MFPYQTKLSQQWKQKKFVERWNQTEPSDRGPLVQEATFWLLFLDPELSPQDHIEILKDIYRFIPHPNDEATKVARVKAMNMIRPMQKLARAIVKEAQSEGCQTCHVRISSQSDQAIVVTHDDNPLVMLTIPQSLWQPLVTEFQFAKTVAEVYFNPEEPHLPNPSPPRIRVEQDHIQISNLSTRPKNPTSRT